MPHVLIRDLLWLELSGWWICLNRIVRLMDVFWRELSGRLMWGQGRREEGGLWWKSAAALHVTIFYCSAGLVKPGPFTYSCVYIFLKSWWKQHSNIAAWWFFIRYQDNTNFTLQVKIFYCSAGLVKQCLLCTKYNTSCSMPNIFSIICAQQGADMLHNDIS